MQFRNTAPRVHQAAVEVEDHRAPHRPGSSQVPHSAPLGGRPEHDAACPPPTNSSRPAPRRIRQHPPARDRGHARRLRARLGRRRLGRVDGRRRPRPRRRPRRPRATTDDRRPRRLDHRRRLVRRPTTPTARPTTPRPSRPASPDGRALLLDHEPRRGHLRAARRERRRRARAADGRRMLKGKDLRVWHEALSLATLVALAVHALALLGDGYLKPSLPTSRSRASSATRRSGPRSGSSAAGCS